MDCCRHGLPPTLDAMLAEPQSAWARLSSDPYAVQLPVGATRMSSIPSPCERRGSSTAITRPACLSGDASGQGSCLASSATRRRGRSAGRADVAVDWLPRDAAAQPTPQASAAFRGRLAASPSWRNRPRCTTAPHAPGKRPRTCSSRRSPRQRDACLSRSASKHLAPRQHAPRRRPT